MPKRMFLLLLARKVERCLATTQFIIACLSTLSAISIPAIAIAQSITSDGSTGTIITPENNANPPGNSAIFNITGGQLSQDGTNLFHSFSQFGVEANQTANFVVPANAAISNILGRVTGGNPSVINGLIQVTGGTPNLLLLNPAGIVFGTEARLNVPADFTATTATRIGFGNNNWFNAIGTNDYSALIGTPSTFAFGTSATPGAIINAGNLAVAEGKNLSLLGGTVINTGQLTAPGGNITVAAVPGQNLIRISQAGHLLNLEIQPCGNTSDCTLPSNSGTDTGTVPLLPNPLSLPQLLTGSASNQVTGLAVDAGGQVVLSQSGLVVPQLPGTVVLSGTANASTTTPSKIGGSVQLRGNLVGLVEKAQVDVSGDAGGGRVLIGGDVGGQGVANELRTVVGPDVTINANAKSGSSGNGGQVRIWADTTRFLGQVNAQGGTTGGSGGFVEISGNKNLTFSGTVETLTQNAGRGTLFLNSSNFTLTDAPAVSAAQNRNLADNSQFLGSDNSTGSNTLSWGQMAELATKNNIVLQATGSIAIADIIGNTPSVSQNNQVNLGPKPGTLTLRSTEGSIAFQDLNDTLQISGSNITLEAADKITAGNFLTNGGAVTLRADKNSLTVGQINTSSASGDGGKVTLNAAKDITIHSIDTRSLSNGTGGSVDITTSGLFRATGKNSSNISIATEGGTRGGAVNLRHGGGSLSVPFTVGSDYNGINGTAGAISTGTGNQIPAGVFASSYTQGKSPSDIQISTSGSKTSVLSQVQATTTPQQSSSPQQTNSSPQQQSNFNQTPLSTSSNSSPVEIEASTGFVELEESFTQEFEQYFGRTFNVESQNVTQANETLEEIDRVTGIQPAFIYAVFVPTTLGTPTPQSSASRATEELELLLVTAQGKPIRKRVEGATRERVLTIAQEFRSNVTNLRSRDYLSSAQQLYQWLIAPLAAELQAQKIDNLVFVLDSGLRSIPLAALYDGREFLVERYSVAMMPSLSLTDTRYRNIQNSRVLAMGAEQFPDQKPLPAVPLELSLITQQLWQGKAFLNKAFTLENLKAQRRQQSFGIIHLATHADFLPGKPENSYIQLSNSKLRLNQIPQLNWSQPPVELLVLSACRTAVGNEQAELGFAGLAVQAGVKSAIASLWLVNDEATLGLMTQFYKQLKDTPIKAEALRQAQLAMLKGQVQIKSGKLYTTQGEVTLPPALANLGDQELRHPYYWAAFTLIGNPW